MNQSLMRSGSASQRRERVCSQTRYFLIFPFLFWMILAGGCSGKKQEPPRQPSAKAGVEAGLLAPDFKIKNIKGGLTTLSEYRGKVILINFWATWCGPCRAEMPSMEALYRSYPRKDFEILAVSIDTAGEPPVRSYVEDFGFTFPVLLDYEFTLNDQYQVRVVPTSLLVDRQGLIAHRALGGRDWNDPDMRALVAKIVGANRPASAAP